jgi:hypothetical protein
MIEIFCRKCHGTGGKEYDYKLETVVKCCDNCKGKGYTEYEGDLKDLELGLAVNKFCERKPDKLYFYDYMGNEIEITPKDFIDWYREQKGGK